MSTTIGVPVKPATLADLEALPETVRGEIIDGVLYTLPRPRAIHSASELRIGADVEGPFQRGRGGPGGWWILVEPGITCPGSPEFSPDLAGWRRERLPRLPDTRIDVVPDWVCEVLSPSTRSYDQRVKRPFYARIGVPWLWYVDVDARTLSVNKLEGGRWVEWLVAGERDKVKPEPFDAVELDLAGWWSELPA